MANTTISASIQTRRDTLANWNASSATLKAGEIGLATDANGELVQFRIGSGSGKAWSALTPCYINGVNKVVYEGVECDNNSGTVTISGITASQAVTASYAHVAHIAETGGTVVEYVKSSSRLVDDTSAHNVMSSGSLTQPVYFDKGIPKACTQYRDAYVYSASKAKNAETASRLSNTTAIGDTNTPVYIDSTGLPKTCSSIGGLSDKLDKSTFNSWTGSTNSTFKGTAATASFVTASNVKGTVVSSSYAVTASYAQMAYKVADSGGMVVTGAEHADYLVNGSNKYAVGTDGKQIVYFNQGVPVASTVSTGSTTRPVYMSNGKFELCNEMPNISPLNAATSSLNSFSSSVKSWSSSINTATSSLNSFSASINGWTGSSSSTFAGKAAKAGTADQAAKLSATAQTGSGVKPIYFNNGIPVQSTSTLGNSTKPVYLSNGELKECSEYPEGISIGPLNQYTASNESWKISTASIFSGEAARSAYATSSGRAAALGDSTSQTGSSTRPIYLNANGIPKTCSRDIPDMTSWAGAVPNNLIPDATNTRNLGSTGKYWKNAYITSITGSLNGTATNANTAYGIAQGDSYIDCGDDITIYGAGGVTLQADDNNINIQPGGSGELIIAGNVIPTYGGSYSLGSSTYNWKSANIVSITGSLFGTATNAANAAKLSTGSKYSNITIDTGDNLIAVGSGSLNLVAATGNIWLGAEGSIYAMQSIIPETSSTENLILGFDGHSWASASIKVIHTAELGGISGNDTVTVQGNLVPSSSEDYELGDMYHRWGIVYTDQIHTTGSLILRPEYGDVVLSTFATYLRPEQDSACSLGSNNIRWDTMYARTSNAYTYTGSNAYFSGDVVAGYTSDRRLKEDIKPIESTEADEVLQALKPVSFKWNKLEEELTEGHRHGIARSFIADEFLQVLPNAGQKVHGDYDGIYIEQVIPYLVAGYQKQQQEIDDLRKEIAELKAKLA